MCASQKWNGWNPTWNESSLAFFPLPDVTFSDSMSHGRGISWPGHGCFVCRVWLDNKSLVLLSRSLSRDLLQMFFWKAQFRWYPTELKIVFKTCASTFNDIQCKMCMLFVRYTGLDLVVIYCHFIWFRMVNSSFSPSTDIQKLKHLRWRPIDHLARSTGSEAQIGFRCIYIYYMDVYFHLFFLWRDLNFWIGEKLMQNHNF